MIVIKKEEKKTEIVYLNSKHKKDSMIYYDENLFETRIVLALLFNKIWCMILEMCLSCKIFKNHYYFNQSIEKQIKKN